MGRSSILRIELRPLFVSSSILRIELRPLFVSPFLFPSLVKYGYNFLSGYSCEYKADVKVKFWDDFSFSPTDGGPFSTIRLRNRTYNAGHWLQVVNKSTKTITHSLTYSTSVNLTFEE